MNLARTKGLTVAHMIPLSLLLVSGCAKSPLLIKGEDMESHLHSLAENWPASRIPLEINVDTLVEKEYIYGTPWFDGYSEERIILDHKEVISSAQEIVNSHLGQSSDESVKASIDTIHSFYALGNNSDYSSAVIVTIHNALLSCNGEIKFFNTVDTTLNGNEPGHWDSRKVNRDAMTTKLAVAVIGALEEIYTACE